MNLPRMKHLDGSFILAVACTLPTMLPAQMDFFRASSFGSRFNDINDNGLAVSGGAYFDFPTLTWTNIEPGATSTESINNEGEVAGSMYLDEANGILQPAWRKNGVWLPIGWLPTANPEESFFSTHNISPNGTWVTGQMSIGCCDYGAFRYNTETEELTGIFDPAYVAMAGYFITDDGTIGGWADDEGTGSTRRIPVYITPELEIVPVSPTLPTALVNAVSAINSSYLMAGDIDDHPFLFDRNTNTFTTFDVPAGYLTASFTSLSDNGIAVGFAQNFDDFGGLVREALVYHPNLGTQPVFLKDILLAHGVDIEAPSGRMGTAIAISPNGEYIAGWDDGAPFSANGWIAYLDDLLLGTAVAEREAGLISLSPNPATDLVRIASPMELGTIEVLHANGQVVMQQAMNATTALLDLSGLSAGVYTVRTTNAGTRRISRLVKN